MRSRSWLALLLAVSGSWQTLAQGLPGRAAESAIHEIAPKLKGVIHDVNKSLSYFAVKELAEKIARELRQTPRDYVVYGITEQGFPTSGRSALLTTPCQHVSYGKLAP